MPNVSFLQNPGDAIIIGGNAYQFVGVTSLWPPSDIGEVEYSSIDGITYTDPDPQGNTIFTKGQRAQARFEFGSRGGGWSAPSTSSPINKLYGFHPSDPTVNDDNTQNWVTGALWVNTSTGKVFVNSSVATGAAVWTWRNTDGTLVPVDGAVVRFWGGSKISMFVNDMQVSSTPTNNGIAEVAARSFNIAPGSNVGHRRNSSTGGGSIYLNVHPFLSP